MRGRASLRKKLAQKAWSESDDSGSEEEIFSNPKRNHASWKTHKPPRSRKKNRRTVDIDAEAIPIEMHNLDEDYDSEEHEEDGDLQHDDFYTYEDDEEETHLRAFVPHSKYEIYNTEQGEKFLLQSIQENNMLAQNYTSVGLDRKQHTLTFRRPEHPGPGSITGTNPITEDGYLNKAERDAPTIHPYRPRYVKELLDRNDVIRTHPDYEFLSQFASHLSLMIEDVFLEESVTRKQAATSALLEAVTARHQARSLQLQTLGRRMERLRNSITIAQEDLDAKVGSLLETDSPEAVQIITILKDKLNNLDAISKFHKFVFLVQDLLGSRGLNMRSVRNQTAPAEARDNMYISHAEDYLKLSSPNSNRTLTRQVLRNFSNFKGSDIVGTAAKNALLVFALVDFYMSFVGTFSDTILFAFMVPAEPAILIPPGLRGRDWRSINIRLVLSKDEDDKDKKGVRGKRAISEEERSEVDLLDAIFAGRDDHEIPRFVRTNLIQDVLDTLDTETLASYVRSLGENYNSIMALLVGLTGGPTNHINDLADAVVISEHQINADAKHMSGEAVRFLARDNIEPTLGTLGIGVDLAALTFALAGGHNVYEQVHDILARWRTSLSAMKQKTSRDIHLSERAVEEIQDRIDVITRTGRGPGEAEIDVPFRTSLEWALKPINTGRMEVASWVTSAINSGHAAFKRYAARGQTFEWTKIDRNIIQRDELMGPLFAEFCATFVSKAKIANPRRYMRSGAEKERLLRKASILKSMLMDLRYISATKSFSTF